MNKPTYTIVEQLERDKWEGFVAQHPRGTIFQTPEMWDFYVEANLHEPLLVAALDENQNVAGLMLAVIQGQYQGALKQLTDRAIIFGAPLARDGDRYIREILLDAYEKIIKKRVVYSQFRNLWVHREDEKETFETLGFMYEPHLDIHMDLTDSEGILEGKASNKRMRNYRKAIRKGLVLKQLTEPAEVETAFELIRNNYTRIKLPTPEKSFIDSAYRILFPKGMVKYFAAIHQEKIVSVRMELCYGDTIYDWWAGTREEYLKMFPNDFLPWEIVMWGQSQGYRLFDFGGAGKPGVPYGVRDFKLKFGGKLLEFGRYEKFHKPLLMKIAKVGLKLWKKLR